MLSGNAWPRLLVCLVWWLAAGIAEAASGLRLALVQAGIAPTVGAPNSADMSLAVQLALSLVTTSANNMTVSTVINRLTATPTAAMAQALSAQVLSTCRAQCAGATARCPDVFRAAW